MQDNIQDIDELISDEDLKGAHILRQRQILFEEIYKYICRGYYNVKWLVDRFTNDLFPPEEIRKLILLARERIVQEYGSFNPQLEVLSYMSTNAELKRTLFDQLDKYKDDGKPRTTLELVKAIAALDAQRMDFAKFVGLAVKLDDTQRNQLNHNLPAADLQFTAMLEDADAIEHRLNSGNTEQRRALEPPRNDVREVEIEQATICDTSSGNTIDTIPSKIT